MQLDEDIEERLVDYLRLEFGEATDDENALKQSDLEYLGEFVLDGESAHYWNFPSSMPCWAVVKPFGESYCLSMTVRPPGNPVQK